MEYLLFVYGTLRRGESNHHFLKTAVCLTQEAYIHARMYDTDDGYPAVTLDQEAKTIGELYLIDEETLCIIDLLEDYEPSRSSNLYDRVAVTVFSKEQEYRALVYVIGASMPYITKEILEGDWVRYKKISYSI